jgi:hypothetical protein
MLRSIATLCDKIQVVPDVKKEKRVLQVYLSPVLEFEKRYKNSGI